MSFLVKKEIIDIQLISINIISLILKSEIAANIIIDDDLICHL